jgi:hypothetical protein
VTARRALRLLVAAALLIGCGGREGLYRDQLLFLGDDGAVLALVLGRRTNGDGEAKGWLGAAAGSWEAPFYARFPVAPRRASDLGASVRAWSSAAGGAVRASFRQDAAGTHLALRTRSARLSLDSARAAPLGAGSDPEGASVYAAARATVRTPERDGAGWLVTETTPEDAPRRGFVEYGDFTFLVAARPNGDLVVAKHSRGARGFDQCLVRRAGRIRRARRVAVDLAATRLVVTADVLPEPLALDVRDRDRTTGVAPSGRALGYEALLLGGDWTGVAFTIRPAR